MSHASQETDQIKAEKTRILADLRATFSSDHGKRTLEILKQRAAIDRPASIPTAGTIDPNITLFRDGRKSIVLELLADLAIPADDTPEQPKAVR